MAERNQGLPRSLDLWPEEYHQAWDGEGGRLFVASLAAPELGTPAVIRVTIRGTGIAATVSGKVAGLRRAGASVPAGLYLGMDGRGRGAADYLARVARNQPVDFNERSPRYATAWQVVIAHGNGRFEATTLNVSEDGCQLAWPGPALQPGSEVRLRPERLLWGGLRADVRWARQQGTGLCTAGLHLEPVGRGGRRWVAAVERAGQSGAPRV